MMLRGKKIAQRYAPNPKEIKYWIDLTEDNQGKIIKVYVNNKWTNIEDLNKPEQQNAIIEEKVDYPAASEENVSTEVQDSSVEETFKSYNKKFHKKHKKYYQENSDLTKAIN